MRKRSGKFLKRNFLSFLCAFLLAPPLWANAESDFTDEPETAQHPKAQAPSAEQDTRIDRTELPETTHTKTAAPDRKLKLAPPPAAPTTPAPPPPLPPTGWDKTLIETDIAVAKWFDGAAEGIDLFLMGKKLTDKPNNTQVNIENSTFSREAESVTNTSSLNVNLRLPNLEEYWQLKFASYDEQEESRNVQSGYLRTTPRERNYGATVGFFRKLGNVRTAFQPRMGFDNPFKVSHSLSFESVVDYKIFQFNPKIEFYAKPNDGTGIFFRLNFNYILTPVFSLTQTNEGEYRERLHLFTGNNGLTLGQGIDDRNSMSYSIFFGSSNKPSYMLDGYSLALSYNHLIYKKILDVQLIPHLDFAYVESFKGVAGITMNFNLYF